MKVLIVSQYFWPETFRINSIAEALQRAGCEVSVLTGQPNYPDGRVFPGYRAWASGTQLHPSGCTIFRVPLIPRGDGGGWSLTANYLSFVISSIVFGWWKLRRRQFDIVLVYGTSPILQGIPGVFFSAIKRAAHVLWVQDLWPESLSATGYVRSSFMLGRVADIVRWIYRRCDLLLVQSRGFVSCVSKMAGKVPVIYFPNPGGIELDAIAPPAISLTLPAGFNVTFSGNVGTVQSVETLVEAATWLSGVADINLVILGSGGCLGWMEKEIKQRGLTNIFLLGRVTPEVAIDALARSDALVVTLKNAEALNRTIPSKLSTYLGVGKPIIACMNGEGADLVRASGAGLACEAENARELARSIVELKALPQAARDAMGVVGRKWYLQHFELFRLTDMLIEYFQEASLKRQTRA